ncbi:biotin--protein ligase isoform X2 [Phyllopteryx taeniolatus]|uniref:biotin--protein ligase isoform X2 n=1 Tax=Phyllopteryx taeniolatus TaxID=161469 RepID=UPI002AD44E87|nr:biotin--protein ligase isoform X2 [Phyllopteryx taeniolatus]
MLITLCYVYLWVRFQKCYSLVIRNRLSTLNSKRSLSFIRSSRSSSVSVLATTVAPAPCQHSPEDDVFLQLGDKSVTVTELKVCDDIIKWNVLSESAIVCGPQIDNISFIIEASGHSGTCKTPNNEPLQVLKWSDFCQPLACSPGQPFRAVAQASVEDFGRLAVAFLEDRLQLDNGLAPSKIVPIFLKESILSEPIQCPVDPINVKSILFDDTQGVNGQPLPFHMLPHLQHSQCCKSNLPLTPYSKKKLEKLRVSGPTCFSQDQSTNSEHNFLGNHHHMESHGHSLHLSSCHECLELENSTILSVKYSSAENISDIPDDPSLCLDSEHKTFDDFELDVKSNVCKSYGFEHKLPNVVVYTNGSKERFRAVHRVLTECLNMEKYIIYSLQPQQALSEPWIENTRLLVLAEEEVLTPQLHTRFLNYLSHGGRVLGLASSLCPAGISLENRDQQPGKVCRLSFTRKDCTELELNVLATGKVFVRDVQGQGNLRLLGELKDCPHQKHMVIIRVTHGEHGGEAVLCQIHLESTPDFQNLPTEGFDGLKVNNALQHQVLVEILTSLGLSCQQNKTPARSPVYLLATSQEAKAKFLQCLHTQVNDDGLVMMSKASLRILPSTELQDGAFLHDCSLSLFTDTPESQNWDQFCFDTYCNNLTTVLLGHTLLYAEVVSSTMDLVEGFNLHLPEDVGLIVVAAQQSHGRGRGRNAWLSPLGCAMFTLCVQIKLSSRLGQKISFLQHLAALAVIEAVRTLPGYEDIDLRIKWPNDIYNSKLMKLGGVLVTSTVMGSTFHLLIGCGFNVSNSNPTVCINDLIQKYNIQHNCDLQPLSCAQFIARTVSCLEDLIDCFQRGGAEAILPIYYKRWLHSGGLVHLWSEDGPDAEVVGLDSNGFLQVHNMNQGIVSVEPDGNSFDMLKNLVVIKQH